MDNKVEKLEQKINLMKEEPYVIHKTILGNWNRCKIGQLRGSLQVK